MIETEEIAKRQEAVKKLRERAEIAANPIKYNPITKEELAYTKEILKNMDKSEQPWYVKFHQFFKRLFDGA